MSYATKGGFDPSDSPNPDDAPLDFEAIGAEEAIAELREAQRNAARTEQGEQATAQGEGPSESAAWDTDLPRNPKTQSLLNTFRVLCVILRSSPEFQGRLWWSEMLLRPMLDNEPITEALTGILRERIEELYAIQPTPQNMRAAIISVSRDRSRHEAKEWLLSLPVWDKKKRLARVPKEILHTSDTLASRLFARFCISAVARVFDPGCKADCALVITGEQGMKKSTFFEVLVGKYFSDADIDIQNKDSVLQLYRSWFTEWSEIERVTSRKAADVVKAWLSRKCDFVRLPYGSSVEDFPRTSVIVGTTNKPEFLNDETGDRRFWVIEIQGRTNIELLTEWREQLWAEAIAAYEAGEPWWLTPEEERRRDQSAKSFREGDPWEPVVELWLLKNPTLDFVTTAEVLTQAIGMKASEIRREHESRVGMVMRALEWERYRPRSGNTDRKRGYRKKPSTPTPPSNVGGPTGPSPAQPPVQPTSPHKNHGGPTGPTPTRASYSSDESADSYINNAANSPIHNTSGWTGWTGLDHVVTTKEFRSTSWASKPSTLDRASASDVNDLPDLTPFVADCLNVCSSGDELAVVVVSLYAEWAKLTQSPQLSRVALMHTLVEHGFTLEGDRVYGLQVRDSWVETLNAAEEAMERAAILDADALGTDTATQQGAKQ